MRNKERLNRELLGKVPKAKADAVGYGARGGAGASAAAPAAMLDPVPDQLCQGSGTKKAGKSAAPQAVSGNGLPDTDAASLRARKGKEKVLEASTAGDDAEGMETYKLKPSEAAPSKTKPAPAKPAKVEGRTRGKSDADEGMESYSLTPGAGGGKKGGR